MKKRLFIDMDGTVARFHDEVNYLERMFEKGFFENLEPFQKAISGLKLFYRVHPEVELYIITSTIDGYPPYCQEEKYKWLDKWMSFIDKEHILFPKIGQNKADAVPGGIITENDYLYDDYNKNLEEWAQAGGSSIKCHNTINHKGLVGSKWQGAVVANFNSNAILLSNDETMKAALKEYNDIMCELGGEHHTIGTPFSEKYTAEWNLRDMISELSYALSTYYEIGHANQLMQHSKDEDERDAWKKETKMLKRFISEYEETAQGLIFCASNHCSKYDNAEEGYAQFVNELAYSMGIGRDPSIDDGIEDEDAEM
ncbi:MAG: hypothetical protein J6D27_00355 [Ruminiclostridium sp.]|nr:hypothetical protein [Ruminiclostridium sp.]